MPNTLKQVNKTEDWRVVKLLTCPIQIVKNILILFDQYNNLIQIIISISLS